MFNNSSSPLLSKFGVNSMKTEKEIRQEYDSILDIASYALNNVLCNEKLIIHYLSELDTLAGVLELSFEQRKTDYLVALLDQRKKLLTEVQI